MGTGTHPPSATEMGKKSARRKFTEGLTDISPFILNLEYILLNDHKHQGGIRLSHAPPPLGADQGGAIFAKGTRRLVGRMTEQGCRSPKAIRCAEVDGRARPSGAEIAASPQMGGP
jgi:hypothetical protein